MSRMPEIVEKPITKASDGYTVHRDYDGISDCVHIPPHDPETAARNRKQLNAVLARYGYKLKEVVQVSKNTPDVI